jgi:PRTRC genetic system ThiF family protein
MAIKSKNEVEAPPDIMAMGGFQIPRTILIVGCGGTGAYVAGHLARLVSVLNRTPDAPYQGFSLVLADGDKVEPKNLERQHFVHGDLDLNKAEVLAARYAGAFGIEIRVIASYLEGIRSIADIEPDMVIGCVDNNASRRVIHGWASYNLDYNRDRFWIDSGNEENSGQVVCGFVPPPYADHSSNDSEYGDGLFSLPMVTEVYPGILETGQDEKFASQMSCAELAQAAPQNMMANITAATIVLNFAQKIMRGRALRAHGTVFSVDNSFRTLLNTPENLGKVDPKRRRSWERHSAHK